MTLIIIDSNIAPKFSNTKFKIHILTLLPQNTFPISQLGNDKSNIKKPKAPTPYYNHGILEDIYYHQHLERLHEYMKDCVSLVEAAILLKVWSRQRGIYFSYDGVNGFLLSILLIYLMSKSQISKHMSSFQMMKVLMQWIVSQDLTSKGISFSFEEAKTKEALKNFNPIFDCVVLDEDNCFNIFYRVSKSAWRELQHEA